MTNATTTSTTRVRPEDERAFIELAFKTVGVDEGHARDIADVLLASDIRGIESHGIARLRWFYVDRIRLGTINRTPDYKVVRETPTSFLLDADNGLGHPPSILAMKKAIELARENGIAFAAVRNSNHYGIAGYYAMMALEHDMIGMSSTNSIHFAIPTFGRAKMQGTNPFAYAVPAGRCSRSQFAMRSSSGIDTTYVGDRCSIVTCAAFFASSGTSVTAVAPLPMTYSRTAA